MRIFIRQIQINFTVLFFILLWWHYLLPLQLRFKMSGRERKIAIMGYRSVGKLFCLKNELYFIHGWSSWSMETSFILYVNQFRKRCKIQIEISYAKCILILYTSVIYGLIIFLVLTSIFKLRLHFNFRKIFPCNSVCSRPIRRLLWANYREQ